MIDCWDELLPGDWRSGTFIGRIDDGEGPTPILIADGEAHDMSRAAPTVAALLTDPVDPTAGRALGPLTGLDPATLLSPVDLHCIKAAGVTFATSTLERVIEERAAGDPARAEAVRGRIEAAIGARLASISPGSAEAGALKAALVADGLWSQYLEVAIGRDAEIFTKAPVLATVGTGAAIGVRSDSHWNNPEPEIALIADPTGRAIGATLGNDVNLRDVEGRSALLLGKAKDNNASAALGPLIRLFDADFGMADIRAATVALKVRGDDGFTLTGESSMREISRDPEELLRQAMDQHQYPDGLVLYLGTMFAPTADRGAPGMGFTHHRGDVVTIASERLGRLVNRVLPCSEAPAWRMGIGALMANLKRRGLI